MKLLLLMSTYLISLTVFAVTTQELTEISESLYQSKVSQCREDDQDCLQFAKNNLVSYRELIANVEVKENNISTDTICEDRIKSTLKLDSQKYLFEKFPDNHKTFGLSCNKDNYLDRALVSGVVILHESAHFEDLGWDGSRKFNLLTVTNKHLGSFTGLNSLPRPSSIINPYLDKNFQDLISTDSFFNSMHEGYIADLDSAASTNIEGLSTELNGYTHGFTYEKSIRDMLSSNNVIGSSQIDGIYYYLTMFNIYLNSIKENNPGSWKSLNDGNNKKLLQTLFNDAVNTLSQFDHCKNASEISQFAHEWLEFTKTQPISNAMKVFLPANAEKIIRCM